jgi:nitrogen fixation NifU-like protein
MFSPQVLDHFEHPRNTGELLDASAKVQVENPVCGDVLEFSLKMEQGIITAARFRAKGCVASVACASKLAETLSGKTPVQAKTVNSETLAESLGGLPDGSMHASQLAIDALTAALAKL